MERAFNYIFVILLAGMVLIVVGKLGGSGVSQIFQGGAQSASTFFTGFGQAA